MEKLHIQPLLRHIFFYLLQFTWGLSVNLVGLVVFLCCKRFPRETAGACRWDASFLPAPAVCGKTTAFAPMNTDIPSSALFSAPCTGLLSRSPVLSGAIALPVIEKSTRFHMMPYTVSAGPPPGGTDGAGWEGYPMDERILFFFQDNLNALPLYREFEGMFRN